MYLGIGALLAKYAHDASTDLNQRAVFSTITTLLHGAITVQSVNETIRNAHLAQSEIQQAVRANGLLRTRRAA